jgi:hypothetical protein
MLKCYTYPSTSSLTYQWRNVNSRKISWSRSQLLYWPLLWWEPEPTQGRPPEREASGPGDCPLKHFPHNHVLSTDYQQVTQLSSICTTNLADGETLVCLLAWCPACAGWKFWYLNRALPFRFPVPSVYHLFTHVSFFRMLLLLSSIYCLCKAKIYTITIYKFQTKKGNNLIFPGLELTQT